MATWTSPLPPDGEQATRSLVAVSQQTLRQWNSTKNFATNSEIHGIACFLLAPSWIFLLLKNQLCSKEVLNRLQKSDRKVRVRNCDVLCYHVTFSWVFVCCYRQTFFRPGISATSGSRVCGCVSFECNHVRSLNSTVSVLFCYSLHFLFSRFLIKNAFDKYFFIRSSFKKKDFFVF